MEGRAIARPNLRRPATTSAHGAHCFNGGPSNCPAKPAGIHRRLACVAVTMLQWRAEQLPGQTSIDRRTPSAGTYRRASMEGRAIARPNVRAGELHVRPRRMSLQWRAEQLPGQTSLSVSDSRGRLAVLQWRAEQLPGQTPPHSASACATCSASRLQWRAEQLPGQTRRAVSWPLSAMPMLQWRAEQLPGQTPTTAGGWASMEGRAIARPNLKSPNQSGRSAQRPCFNGGPSNCPAKPDLAQRPTAYRSIRFNGGPSNCPAKPHSSVWDDRHDTSFNGGPSNCPAKHSHRGQSWPVGKNGLQWRAEQLPGQTARLIWGG